MQVGSLSGNRNLIVILLIIVEIGLGVYYYFTKYQEKVAEVEQKKLVVEQMKKDVREVELTKQLLEETRQEIEKLKTDIARLEKFFPEDVFVPRVLVLIENLAIATHVDIESIRPGREMEPVRRGGTSGGATPAPATGPVAGAPATTTPAPGAPATPGGGKAPVKFNEADEYKTSQVDLKVKGTFQNIYNFMNELATFPKLVVVEKISLTGEADNKAEGSGKSGGGEEDESGAPETGKEVEVGGYVMLSVDLPLTFYVQKKEAPSFDF